MNEKTIAYCPRCNQRIVRAQMSGDYVHQCSGQETLKNEDVLVIGNWEDYTGSDVNVNNVNRQGQENKLAGTRAAIEGAKEPPDRTSRGFPTNRFRSRQHLHYIPESEFKNKGESSVSDPESYDD